MSVVPVITGLGLVTALGRSVAGTWDGLLTGGRIIDHSRVDAAGRSDISRVSALGIEAAEQAVAQSHWSRDGDAAVICCTSKGSIESWTGQRRTLTYGLADLSEMVAHHTGQTNGPRLTLSAACAGGLHGLIRAAMMIKSGEANRVLVVASEASVHPLFLGSFQRLGVLPKAGELCRPFDLNRDGFLMSDAAAAVCVEARDLDRDTGLSPVIGASDAHDNFKSEVSNLAPEAGVAVTPQVCIDGFAMGGDATHLTGSDPEGRVLRLLLRTVIGNSKIDLVHAHGTGTVSNDATELAAIEASLANGSAQLYSHKAAIGHSLGASGLVGVVISCMCHQTGVVPPNINTSRPMATKKLSLSRSMTTTSINRSVVLAAGFGGPMAAIALRSTGVPPME